MNIDDTVIADMVASRLANDASILCYIRQHVGEMTAKAELLTPRVAASLLKVDQRTLAQIATPIRLTERVTRYRLSEITHLSS